MTPRTTALDESHRRDAAHQPTSSREPDDAFVPKGAIAFFAAMLSFYVLFWFGLYALLVQRG